MRLNDCYQRLALSNYGQHDFNAEAIFPHFCLFVALKSKFRIKEKEFQKKEFSFIICKVVE